MEAARSVQVRDLSSVRPRLREALRFLFQDFKGETYCVIEDSVSSKFHRIGLAEYGFIRKLDGRYTVAEAHALASAESGADALTEAEAESVLAWLVEQHLVELGGDIPLDRLTEVRSKRMNAGLKNVFNLLFIRVPIGSPDAMLNRISGLFPLLCSRWVFALWSLLLGSGVISVLSNWDRFTGNAEGILSRSNWFWLLLVWVLLKVWHEFWHAVTCKYYGGPVRECGVLFVLFAPLGYVDATASLAFDSKWQRIRVALAGIYGEFFIASIAAIVWSQTAPGMLNTVAFNTIVMASTVTLLFNLNPLMRFDGYYVLTEWVEIPNLATRSNSLLRSLSKSWFLAVDGIRMPDWRDSETWIFLGYGIAALMWRIFIMVTLAVAASVLFGGGGQLLTVVALSFWFLPMVVGLFKYIHEGNTYERPRIRSAYLRLALVAAGLGLLMVWPVRSEVEAPGALRYAQEHIYRAEADGFLSRIHIATGASVEAGAPLVEISNPQLEAELKRLKIELDRQTIRQRWARVQQSPAEFAAEQARLEALQTRYEAEAKVIAAMTIEAAQAGLVVAPGLDALTGRFITEGEPLLSVVEGLQLELAVAISQKAIDSYLDHLGGAVEIFFTEAGRSSSGRLVRIDGRATQSVDVPELTQVGGGPLAVRAGGTGSGEAELVNPVFMAVVEVPEGIEGNLRPGQRAVVRFKAAEARMLIIHGYDFMWNAIHSLLQTAQRAVALNQ